VRSDFASSSVVQNTPWLVPNCGHMCTGTFTGTFTGPFATHLLPICYPFADRVLANSGFFFGVYFSLCLWVKMGMFFALFAGGAGKYFEVRKTELLRSEQLRRSSTSC
jgi:hypothetical protein